MKEKQLLSQHCFSFNKSDNGGERVSLTTKFIANGDPNGVFLNQEFSLQSYSNSATINLCGGV